MSLINEALKRAERDKRRNTNASAAAADLSPVYRDACSRSSSRVVVVLIVLALVASLVLSWAMLGEKSGTAPKTATAQPTPAPRPPRPTPTKTPKPVRTAPTTRPASATTSPAARPREAPVKPASQPAPRPSPTSRPAAQDRRPTPKAATRPARRERAAAPKPKPKEKVRIDPTRFRLNGLMYSPSGGTAIINGQLVQPGDILDGAKVVKIHPRTVELQIGAQRFRIRM